MTETNNQNEASERILKTVADVHKYLKSHAWQISKTQLYSHVEQKKIKRDDDGTFSIPKVDKYASKYLRCTDGSKPSKALADIQTRKYEADVRQLLAGAEMKEIKNSILKGEYVRKDAFEFALAERAMLFKNDIGTFCRSKAADIVNLVDGDKEKIPDLINYLLEETANWLNVYSEDREFPVPAPAQQHSEEMAIVDDDEGENEDGILKYQS
jgi:hypothetical protein